MDGNSLSQSDCSLWTSSRWKNQLKFVMLMSTRRADIEFFCCPDKIQEQEAFSNILLAAIGESGTDVKNTAINLRRQE